MAFELKYTYGDMPKSPAAPEGMKILEGDTDNIRGMILPDIEYAEKNGTALHIRMLYPDDVTGNEVPVKHPTLVHIQGSAWFPQDMNNHILDLKEIVTAGYIVAIVQYRSSLEAKIPAQVYDAKDAVRYLFAHAKELGIDTSKVYMSGDSSGGHTCAMCWATWPVKGLLDEGGDELPPIKAFLDFYGPIDLGTMTSQISALDHIQADCPESMALGCQAIDPSNADRVRECSVLTYVDPAVSNAPLLIAHGNKDRLVPFEQSVQLYESAKTAGKDVTFYCINNADHGGSAFFCKAFYELVLSFMN